MDSTTRQALEARATDGLRAIIQLLGDDPDVPALDCTPRRIIAALKAIGAAPPIDLPAVLTSQPVGYRPGDVVEHGASWFDPASRMLVGPLPFTALCGMHLTPYSGTAHLAHDPGPQGYRPGVHRPGTAAPAAWRPTAAALAVVLEHYAAALTSATLLALNVVEALKMHLGGDGAALAVEVTTPCPYPHGDAIGEIGRFHSIAGWGGYADLDHDHDPATAADPARALEFWGWVNLTTVPLATRQGEMYRRELITPDPFGGPLAFVAGGTAGILERTT